MYTVKLSNGQKIVQEEQEGLPSSWIRLKQFLDANKELKIVEMSLYMNGGEYVLPNNQTGYCFGRKKIGVWPGSKNMELSCVGYYDGQAVKLFWFNSAGKVVKEETRTKEKAGFFLINNEDQQNG